MTELGLRFWTVQFHQTLSVGHACVNFHVMCEEGGYVRRESRDLLGIVCVFLRNIISCEKLSS